MKDAELSVEREDKLIDHWRREACKLFDYGGVKKKTRQSWT